LLLHYTFLSEPSALFACLLLVRLLARLRLCASNWNQSQKKLQKPSANNTQFSTVKQFALKIPMKILLHFKRAAAAVEENNNFPSFAFRCHSARSFRLLLPFTFHYFFLDFSLFLVVHIQVEGTIELFIRKLSKKSNTIEGEENARQWERMKNSEGKFLSFWAAQIGERER